jgi:hypothetical protein
MLEKGWMRSHLTDPIRKSKPKSPRQGSPNLNAGERMEGKSFWAPPRKSKPKSPRQVSPNLNAGERIEGKSSRAPQRKSKPKSPRQGSPNLNAGERMERSHLGPRKGSPNLNLHDREVQTWMLERGLRRSHLADRGKSPDHPGCNKDKTEFLRIRIVLVSKKVK